MLRAGSADTIIARRPSCIHPSTLILTVPTALFLRLVAGALSGHLYYFKRHKTICNICRQDHSCTSGRNEAQFLNDRAVDQRNVADAAEPLFASLDAKQKSLFIEEMVRLSRERGLD